MTRPVSMTLEPALGVNLLVHITALYDLLLLLYTDSGMMSINSFQVRVNNRRLYTMSDMMTH